MNMTRLMTDRFVIPLLAVISTVCGCGVIPAGQARTRSFTVTGFNLPVSMVYSTTTEAQTQVPGIASSKGAARGFVQRIVMQTIFDVLERQARSAFLPDALISTILGQLTVNITYEPMECPGVAISRDEEVKIMDNKISMRCIIVDSTVTGLCTALNMDGGMCKMPMPGMVAITSIPPNFTMISGTLSTTNTIMANWSRTMWQDVMNRAVRVLASGPFRSHFFSATGSVGEN
ncbi:hypothetical protein KIN20_035377 [Parelaphostrongylus tenuis]|uniref:Uncharacterized protein n=1 Tax=Parelaphostrongylus tenuis TaxID=148309 RepID=A0AAD5RED2_PARTN|nr:hypothetical protein KIN20_035377 [Parelaphostrongylus tenuis]